jgi:type I restriction enzyme S subunit
MIRHAHKGSIPPKLAADIARIIRRHIPDERYRVFFFGSRAIGRNRRGSDIDVGIDGPKPVPLRTMAFIREELEALPTIYMIDIVDFARVSPRFRTVAMQQVAPAS